MDGVCDARVARPFLLLSLDEVLHQCALCRVDGLHRRSEAHLARLLKPLVLHDEVRIVRAYGIGFCCRENRFFCKDEREACHALDPLLRRGHADVDVHLVRGERDHCIGGDRVHDHDRAVRMGEGADLAHGVQDARTRLLMCRVDGSNVGMLVERALNGGEVGQPVNGEGQIDMRHGIGARHRRSTCGVGAVVDDEEFFVRRHERAHAGVHADRAGPAEKYGRPVCCIGVDDPEEIRAELTHEIAERALARTDIGDELRRLDRVCGRCGAGVEQNVSLDIHDDFRYIKQLKMNGVFQYPLSSMEGNAMRSPCADA